MTKYNTSLIENDVLAAKLREAFAKDGGKAAVLAPKVARWHIEQDVVGDNMVDWESDLFGTIKVAVAGSPIDHITAGEGYTYAKVVKSQKSNRVEILVEVLQQEGIRVYHAKAGILTDVTNKIIPALNVPINWQEGSRPDDDPKVRTRQKDKDSINLLLRDPQGRFVSLEIALETRAGDFWISVQENYGGQIVRTEVEKAQALGVEFVTVRRPADTKDYAGFVVPLWNDNAYPTESGQMQYLKVFPRIGPQLIRIANEEHATVPLSRIAIAEWDAKVGQIPDELRTKGYVAAVVTSYRFLMGFGMALSEDEQFCFIHFNNMIDADGQRIASKGEFPVLLPGQTIAIKHQLVPNKAKGVDERRATAIRTL